MSDDAPALHVEFYSDAVENKAKTKEAGRPIFEDREFVRIKFPGDKHRVLVAPAKEGYRRDPVTNDWVTYAEEFPKHYQAFKDNVEYHGEGTPLSELTFLTDSKRMELRAFNIHTAETLAALDGTPLQKLGMGARELKNQATAWLDKASGSADVTRLAAENAALSAQMDDLRAQVAELLNSGAEPARADEEPLGQELASVAADAFDAMGVPELKVYIKERTGAAPKGNPSRDTLVSMALDVANSENRAA